MKESLYSAKEIVKMAISLEEEGVKFYNQYSEKATGKAKEVLLRLRDDEIQHVEVFKKMYQELDAKSETEDYLFSQDIDDFFHSYVRETGFDREIVAVDDWKEAVRVGAETEDTTVTFYENIHKYANPETKKLLERLIEEEKSHAKVLQDLLKED